MKTWGGGDLYTTRNDPQNRRKHDPKWSPKFFTRDLKWSPRNYRSGMGKHFYLGDKIKAFYSVFRLIRNAKFFGYKREIFSKWLIDCTKLFTVRRSLFRWTFYQKISWIQQCRWTRGLQLWFYSAFWRASSRVGSISAVSRVRSLILPNSGW